MKKPDQRFVAIILGYLNIALHNLSTLILTPTMISEWGGSSYGLYKIILSFLTYFLLIDSGIRNTVVRFVAEYRAKNNRLDERRYITVIMSYYLVAALALSAIVFIFSLFIPQIYANSLTAAEIEILLSCLPFLLISTVSTLFFNTFTALLKGHNLQAVVQTINVIRSVLRFVILYTVIKSGASVTETIFSETAIAAIFAVIVLAYIFFVMKLPPLFKGINKGFIKNIVSFTSVMLVYTVSTSLFWSVGNFLVGVMTSAILAAVYATSLTLTNMFQSLSGIISQVLVPDIMVKSFSTDDMSQMNSLMLRIAKIKMPVMLLIVLGFGLFGNEFVHLWVGEGFFGTYLIAFIAMIPLMLGLLQDVPNNFILAKNKHNVLATVSLIGCGLNVVISVILINLLDIYGAALGTIITYSLINIVFTYFYYSKKFGFDMKRLYIETVLKNLPYILILVIIGVLINLIPFNALLGEAVIVKWLIFAFKAALFTVIFAILFFTKMIDKETKKTILKKLGR